MNQSEETFHSRLHLLIQKCRKALRLYTTMGKSDLARQDEYQELQVLEWRELNQDLLKHLVHAVEHPSPKAMIAGVQSLRDRFYSEWRTVEAELHTNHKGLIAAAENGDFIKAALLSKSLVSQKARMQASQAAHHELQELLQNSKLSFQSMPLEQDEAPVVEPVMAKVIPLRKKRSGE
ncbi:MAG: hypothetical protein KDD62_12765 [Bdellovibrionales bacterium]|nr:hypothetical protein [Bdellovibrionales bacterium]